MIKNLIIHMSLYLMNGTYNLHTVTITYFFRTLIRTAYTLNHLRRYIDTVQDEC